VLTEPEGDLPINAIHMSSGFKAELFLLRDGDVYRKIALSRRKLVDLGQPIGKVYVHAPEDLIINKVHYYSYSRFIQVLFISNTTQSQFAPIW